MRKPAPATIIALAALFVSLGGVGVAATGGNFILGRANNASDTTGLTSGVTTGPTLNVTNTGGKSAARFNANAGVAPFVVGNATRIASLNADLLDAKDSTYFLPKTGVAADSAKLGGKPANGYLFDGSGPPDGQPGEDWHEVGALGAPAFATNWENFGGGYTTGAFYDDPVGIIHLKGLVTWIGSTVSGCDTVTIFTLPLSYTPAQKTVFETNFQVDVDTNGAVTVCGTLNHNDNVILDGLAFRNVKLD